MSPPNAEFRARPQEGEGRCGRRNPRRDCRVAPWELGRARPALAWQAELGNFAVNCKSDPPAPRPRDKTWDMAKASLAGARWGFVLVLPQELSSAPAKKRFTTTSAGLEGPEIVRGNGRRGCACARLEGLPDPTDSQLVRPARAAPPGPWRGKTGDHAGPDRCLGTNSRTRSTPRRISDLPIEFRSSGRGFTQDLRAKNQCLQLRWDISRHSSELQRRLAGAPPDFAPLLTGLLVDRL